MGNCFHRCFGIVNRRSVYPKTRYAGEQDFSIENYYMDDGFESLIREEPQHNETTRLLTNRERQLLSTKQFGVLVQEQGKIDAELEAKQTQQEKEIEREEAAFYEAKREAAEAAKLNKDKENSSRNNSKAWVNSDEWEIAGDEDDDFENFLASVRARSLLSLSQEKNGSSDAQILSSSIEHSTGKILTNGSPVAKEWEHSADLAVHQTKNTENSWSKTSTANSKHSSDIEWDPDFVSAEDGDDRMLNV